MKPSWTEVEETLLEQVFYAFDPADVRAATNLPQKGMLDSLSIVAILETLVELTGNEDALTQAQATDFRNLGTIQAFYAKI